MMFTGRGVRTVSCTLASCGLVLLLTCSAAAMDWHASGWSSRAVVGIASKTSGVDVAAVRIHHSGGALPDGDDYRIFDQAGRPVAYQVTYHHPERDTLLSFRCDDGRGEFAVYYGKPGAARDPMRAVVDATPGGGAPKPGPGAGGWIPRAGLVLTTMRRPREATNPKSDVRMAELISQSPGLDGAGYRNNISDGSNPFGDSDYFISVYRGWIDLPKPGGYGFCTASNEASFSFMDGEELVHWPGRHTEQRGKFGQKNVWRDLKAGRHYIEYYHEEVLLYQVAFLGYRPPGAGHFVGIPDSLFIQPHQAQVLRYETAGGAQAVALRPELLDSIWPTQRDEGQYTRYRFVADLGAQAKNAGGWRADWNFGDGLTAVGASVEHVYLKTGSYHVKMMAVGPKGQRIEQQWPLEVFPIEHLAGPHKAGDANAYGPIVAGYDHAKLATSSLAECARFHNEAGDAGAAATAAQAVLGRNDADAADVADMHWIVALASGRSDDPEAVAKLTTHLKAALEHEATPAKRMRILAKLIRSFGAQRADVATAEDLYKEATKLVGRQKLQGPFKAAFREATIAVGDARLYAKRHGEAESAYRLAESLADVPVPLQVRNAKIGAYHETIVQHLRENRLEAALAAATQWRDAFPSDQLRGEVLYWIGRIESMKKRPARAVEPLQLAIEVGQGAEFEAEARWLLAEAYGNTGDADRARVELEALVKSGLSGEFRQKAIDALAGR